MAQSSSPHWRAEMQHSFLNSIANANAVLKVFGAFAHEETLYLR